MRAGLRFAFALLIVSAAQGAAFPERPMPLNGPGTSAPAPALAGLSDHAPLGLARLRERPPLLGPPPTLPGGATSGFSIGPIRADSITRFSRSGKARVSPHYRLDGVTFLGGSVGGTVDGRGGMVTLNWHTGP